MENQRDLLERLYRRSLLRANQASPPWPEEMHEEAMDVWLTALRPIPPEQWPRLFNLAHQTRDQRLFGKPISVDNLKYVWSKLQANLKWDARSERWEDPSGGFYAPRTVNAGDND